VCYCVVIHMMFLAAYLLCSRTTRSSSVHGIPRS
jgi:hypothetical protein